MAATSATSDYPRVNGRGGANWTSGDHALLLGLVAFAALRTASLVFSPLELGVDEAQYWLWSTGFNFGYYTKPPLTSWIIGLSHGLFGHHEWAVRLPAPWLHLWPHHWCCGAPPTGLPGPPPDGLPQSSG